MGAGRQGLKGQGETIVRSKTNASPAATSLAMTTKPRRRSAIAALFAAAIALLLVLPSFASADPLGSNTEFFEPEAPSFPTTLVEGSDGNMWFTDPESPFALSGLKIGRVTPAGVVNEYSPVGMSGGAWGIADGPDGDIWFTEPGVKKVGHIKPSEPATSLVEIEVPGMSPSEFPESGFIATGPDGNLWVALETNGIARITPAGAVTEFSAGLNPEANVCSIAAGPDGNVWFGDCGTTKAVGRITPAGAITEFEVAGEGVYQPGSIALGSDGRLWFPAGKAADERIGAITTAGVVTYYKTPTSPSAFRLTSLTAGPDGNIWGTETNGQNEEQTVTITASGGTYKLGFEGQETGWTGEGTLTGESGSGNVTRATGGKGTWASGSTTVTIATAPTSGSFAVNQLITGTGLQSGTAITACSTTCNEVGSTLTISKTTTSAKTGQALTAGGVEGVSGGPFVVGHTIEGTGISTNATISAINGSTLTLSAVPTAAGEGVSLTAGSKTVTGVTTSTGKLSKGEGVSGAGIQAGTTISSFSEEAGTITLSKVPSSTGAASLSADLPFNASAGVVTEALEKLSTIGAGNVGVDPSGSNRLVSFMEEFARTDVPTMTCDSTKLTGGTCSAATTVEARPHRLFRITPATGEVKPANGFSLKPATTLQRFTGANALAAGPGGTIWYTTDESNVIGKFGTEPDPELTAKIETGSGTVVSNPAGIECSGPAVTECGAEFAKESKVTLTASPAAGFQFSSWKGCDKTEGEFGVKGRQCTVKMSKAKTVSAKFIPAVSLAVTKVGPTAGGTVSTSPAGVNCAVTCTTSTAYYKAGALTLKQKKAKHFHFVEFKGGTGSATFCNGVTTETCGPFTIEANSSIEAQFAEDAKATLAYSAEGGGQGSVKTKPTGIACGYTCTAASAEFYEAEGEIEVTVTLNKGTTSVEWTTGAGTGNCEEGKKVTAPVVTCKVPAGTTALVAKFE